MAKAKAKASKIFTHPIASRADAVYMAAFVAGAVMPFTGGWLVSQAVSPLWPLLVSGITPASDLAVALLNYLTYVLVCLAYVGGLALLLWAYRRLGLLSLPRRTMATGLIVAATISALAIWVSVQPYAFSVNNDLGTYVGLGVVILFGAGYPLGIWAGQRIGKPLPLPKRKAA